MENNVKIINPVTLGIVINYLEELFALEWKTHGIEEIAQPGDIRPLLEIMLTKTAKHYEEHSYKATEDYSNITNDFFDEFVSRSCPDTGYFFRKATYIMYKRAQAYERIENAVGEIYGNVHYNSCTIYIKLEEEMHNAYAEDTTAVWNELLNDISEKISKIRKRYSETGITE